MAMLFGLLFFYASDLRGVEPTPPRQIVVYPPELTNSLHWLARRNAEQHEAAKSVLTLHDFQFADRVGESGIRFEQHSVEEALKLWMPGHYDHGSAVAVADVDGDGLPDLYFVNQQGPNQLWRNLGRGKFEDITAAAGVAAVGRIHVGASFADIDNDGLPDLFVTTVRGGNLLFHNLGGGRFRDITKEAGLDYVGHSSGAVFFDFDNDGLLDLFLVNVGVYTRDQRGPGGYFLTVTNAFSGHLQPERAERSILYRNLGGGKFRDVSAEMKLLDKSWSGDATFTDLNQDGFPDLYVLNMQGDNHYYENAGGRRFTDKTPVYFPKTPWGAMGIKIFDYNLDGRMDVFITDMHSDMAPPQTKTGRVNFSRNFEKMKSERWCAGYWDDAFLQDASNNIFGNAFYENRGARPLVEVSEALGVETYWPWGVSVGDLNADGYEDVFVTAGMGYPFRYAVNSVLLNDGGRRFFDAEFLVGVEPRADQRFMKDMFTLDADGRDKGHPRGEGRAGLMTVRGATSSRSSVLLDLDDDGDLDIVTNEMNDRPMVLISDLAGRHPIHFLKVKLRGVTSNRDGLGATVKVYAGGKIQTRYSDGKSGYLAQSSLPLYFGLGETPVVEKVEVLWPSRKKQTVTQGIPANGVMVIQESGD